MKVDLAITLLLTLAQNAGKISGLIQQAQDEGRDITDEEWATVISDNDAARKALVEAIAGA